MLRSGAENRHHWQSCLALKALTQDIERGGLQFQQTGTKSAITASYLPKDLLKEHQNKRLNSLTIIIYLLGQKIKKTPEF